MFMTADGVEAPHVCSLWGHRNLRHTRVAHAIYKQDWVEKKQSGTQDDNAAHIAYGPVARLVEGFG